MAFPELGPSIPRRGNCVTRSLARSLFRVLGWRFEGDLPDLAKAVVIVAPHTSNWDFLLGVLGMFSLGARFSWLGKCVVFTEPLGIFMRWLGGIPVNRAAPKGVVDQITESINASAATLLALAPEGTRSAVADWRSGFWRIARGAGIPIVPIYFDYARRVIGITPPYEPTEDYEHDLAVLQERFVDVTPCRAAGVGVT